MSDKPNIEADWSAWYNRQPGQYDQDLHVVGHVGLPSSSIQVTLEPGDEGIVDEPDLFVLQCKVEVPEVGTDDWAERDVTWQGGTGRDIERVRIQGDLEAEIKVEIRS